MSDAELVKALRDFADDGYADLSIAAADRIEALTAERDEHWKSFVHWRKEADALTEQLEAARADAEEAEAYAEEVDAKMKDIEQELLRRVKFAEESKKLAGSGTSQKREHYRMHALSEALGAVRNIMKGKARAALAEIEGEKT